MTEVIIDVRERDEFEIEHIENSINVPLSSFSAVAPGVLNQLHDRKVVFMCRSGMRSQQALEQAKGLGFNDIHVYSCYEGGISKWLEQGKEVMRKAGKSPLPLMRQMQIVMGALFIIFATLGTFVNPWFSLATVFFGIGLFYAGMTGDCAVAATLSKAPWNKADPTLQENYCKATGQCQ